MSQVDIKVNMMTAVTEVLNFRKNNPNADHEKIMQHISNIAKNTRNHQAKLGMIASASKALSIIEKNPRLTDKEVIKQVMEEIPNILQKIRE